MGGVLVTVVCITYNHEKYIRNALDGFLSQKTDFQYKIVIHDDTSTDNILPHIIGCMGLIPKKYFFMGCLIKAWRKKKNISVNFHELAHSSVPDP